MCGIAGYVAAGEAPNPALLEAMCDRLRHRGPDGSGYFHDGPVALGHRRLSIIDLSGGAQPLGNEDGSIQVVFNGEIYNYLDLRQDLLRRSHVFTTHSDTEVLVHLYEEVGERLPEYLNGMFAFAIWDARRRELFLARDRFGKKPLYYSTEVPGFRMCFASELKAFAAIPSFAPAINPRSVSNFLALGYVPDPDTIYRGVWKLPPASSLTLGAGEARVRRYWSPAFETDSGLGFDAAVEQIRELAADSVERRMISDVPLGGFLSGGVDSSAVVAFMSSRPERRVKSFSIGFTDKDFDEVQYARMVAERYSTEHYEHTVTPSVEEMLPTLVEHFDEPFADSSAIPTLYLSRMTRQYVTVALSGDGADELFGGYTRYAYADRQEHIRQFFPHWFRRTAVAGAARLYPKFDSLPRIFRAKTTLQELSQDLAQSYVEVAMAAFRYGLGDRILSAEMRRGLDGFSPLESYRARFDRYRHLSPLQQMQAVDLETYLPGDILVKVDRAAMAYSLEARSPWLDYRLAELACRLPAPFKLRGGEGKHIFRKAVEPYVPAAILTRRKMGFGVPMGAWFRGSLKKVFEDLVLRPEMERYLSPPVVRSIWEAHQSGRQEYGRELWTLLMLGCWDDRHYGHRRGELLAAAVG